MLAWEGCGQRDVFREEVALRTGCWRAKGGKLSVRSFLGREGCGQ